MRAQAALFDGIFFLLIVMGATTMLFQFAYNYGAQQDQALRSAYTLDFIQSLMKSIYYIDVGSIQSDKPECYDLADWAGSGSVAECIKLDVEDGNLDNSGAGCGKVGLLGMQCLMHEFMKPYRFSGYSYAVELMKQGGGYILPSEPISDTNVTLCDDANSNELVAVSTPFRVLIGSSKGTLEIDKLIVCVWPRKD